MPVSELDPLAPIGAALPRFWRTLADAFRPSVWRLVSSAAIQLWLGGAASRGLDLLEPLADPTHTRTRAGRTDSGIFSVPVTPVVRRDTPDPGGKPRLAPR